MSKDESTAIAGATHRIGIPGVLCYMCKFLATAKHARPATTK